MTLNTKEPGLEEFHGNPNQFDFSSPNRPDRLRGGGSGRGVWLTTNLSLVPTLKLVELYLHDHMFLRDVYRDIFSFTFNITNRSVYLHVDLLASKV